jgi:hypothetical protein
MKKIADKREVRIDMITGDLMMIVEGMTIIEETIGSIVKKEVVTTTTGTETDLTTTTATTKTDLSKKINQKFILSRFNLQKPSSSPTAPFLAS